MVLFDEWTPKSQKYPTLNEPVSGAFYITEDGAFKRTDYKKGKWLVGYWDNSKPKRKLIWAQVNDPEDVWEYDEGGLGPDSEIEQGVYTKTRVSKAGTVMEGLSLEAADIPRHYHSADDIQELRASIRAVMADLLGSPECGTVVFNYDEELDCFTADVKVDNKTIGKTKCGKLKTLEQDGGSGKYNPDCEIEELKKRIKAVEEALANIQIDNTYVFSDNGFRTYVENGYTRVELKIDKKYLTYTPERELTLVDEGTDSSTEGSCLC